VFTEAFNSIPPGIRQNRKSQKNSFQAPASQTKEAVKTAVKAGYRLIDCANDYDNEHVIGEALEELFAEGVVKRLIFRE